MKAKKILASVLAVTMLFGSGVNVFGGSRVGFAMTAQAEDFGNTLIKDMDRYNIIGTNCSERIFSNEDYENVYDGNIGVDQWVIPFNHVQDFNMMGPYKVTDHETDHQYWGFTSVGGMNTDPDIKNFIDNKGILFEIPEGETRIPAGMLVTNYYRYNDDEGKFREEYKLRLYFGGRAIKLENMHVENDGQKQYDDSIVFETDDKYYVLPECEFDPPSEDYAFGGWRFGKKVYDPGEKVKLEERLNRFVPVWGKPEAANRVNITIEVPAADTELNEKAKCDMEDIRLFASRKILLPLFDETGSGFDVNEIRLDNSIDWFEEGEALPTDDSTGKMLSKKAEAGKKYKASFLLQGNDKYKMTADTKVLINGTEVTAQAVEGMRDVYRCEIEFTCPEPEKPKYMLGDVNDDKKIDIEDAVKVIAHVNGQKALTDEGFERANVDGNDKVDIEDAVAIIAHVNGVKSLN